MQELDLIDNDNDNEKDKKLSSIPENIIAIGKRCLYIHTLALLTKAYHYTFKGRPRSNSSPQPAHELIFTSDEIFVDRTAFNHQLLPQIKELKRIRCFDSKDEREKYDDLLDKESKFLRGFVYL